MKTLVLTGYNEKFKPLADITVPRMQDYANHHGYDFFANLYDERFNPYYQKIHDVINALKSLNGWIWTNGEYDCVQWIDADQLVTNFNDWRDALGSSGVHFSQDWGVDATGPEHFSACGFYAYRDSLPLFEWVESVREQYVNGPFPEQTPLRLAYTENRFPGLMHVHQRRVFNAVPIEVHESVVEPWQPGDFCAHLTNMQVPERVSLAEKILERL